MEKRTDLNLLRVNYIWGSGVESEIQMEQSGNANVSWRYTIVTPRLFFAKTIFLFFLKMIFLILFVWKNEYLFSLPLDRTEKNNLRAFYDCFKKNFQTRPSILIFVIAFQIHFNSAFGNKESVGPSCGPDPDCRLWSSAIGTQWNSESVKSDQPKINTWGEGDRWSCWKAASDEQSGLWLWGSYYDSWVSAMAPSIWTFWI